MCFLNVCICVLFCDVWVWVQIFVFFGGRIIFCKLWCVVYMCLALWECFVSVSVFAHVLLRCVCGVLLCVCHCGDDAIMVCVLLWYMYVYVCIFVCVS